MSKIILYKDQKIHYRVFGKGPVVVLLHGFLESSEIWKNFARRLSAEFRVITVDLPGHGLSTPFRSGISMDDMAGAVRQVLKSLEIPSCVMAGHSMGGYVTLAFAEKYPRLLKGFVLFHSHAAADAEEVAKNRERTIAIVQKDHHQFIRNFIPDLFDPGNVELLNKEIAHLNALADQTPAEGIIAALRGMKVRPDRQHVLLNARVPVLFIIGKNDRRIPMEVIIPQTLLPPHCETLLLDHVGHMGFLEAPVLTCDALMGFARRVL